MGAISKDSIIIKQHENGQKINFASIQKEAVDSKDKELTQVNRDQMRSGRMGNGSLPDYSAKSQVLKDRSNYKAKWPTMDLYDEGSFQGKMFMETTSKSVLFDSRDSKTSDLVRRFSEQIFELDTKSLRLAQNITTPTYNNLVHKELNK